MTPLPVKAVARSFILLATEERTWRQFPICERLNPKTRFPEARAPVFGMGCALGVMLGLASISFEGVIGAEVAAAERQTDGALSLN